MNKTFKLALGIVFTLGVVAGASAQNFPDVPENHWAYDALETMKKNGLLVGYPDGLFRGSRPATRYEMAVAIHATYQHLKNITDELANQIKNINTGGSPTDLTEINNQLKQLRSDVDGMKGWGDDIANLKRMAATFEKELASMGVDIEAMKKDLASLAERVGALEKNKMPVSIHGDVNLLVMAGGSTSNRFGIGVTGEIFGANGANTVGMENDFSVFHEAHLKLAGTNETGPKWHAVLGVGNLLGSPTYGSQSGTPAPLSNHNDVGATDIVFQRLVVEFDTSLVGQGFSASVGRFGYKISPYLLQRPDATPYYSDEYWDNGEWTIDGAMAGFNFGSAKLNAFVGRNRGRSSSTGVDLNPMVVGSTAPRFVVGGARPVGLGGGIGGVLVDQTLGFHLNVPLSDKGDLDLAYLFHGSRQTANNRAQVFGGDLNWDFGMIDFKAGYAQSNVYAGDTSVITRNNAAWNIGADYGAERWAIGAQYREVQPLFQSAGDWGRIGMWWNPTDIKGFDVKAHFDLTDNLRLNAQGMWYSGLGKAGVSGMSTNDKVNSYKVGIDYRMNESWTTGLGFELVDWDLRSLGALNGKPRERWYNIGLGYDLSDMAKLSFLWQISDYDGKATPGFGGRFTGNLLTTQLSIKF
jgi:S-layer homology domain